MNLVQSAVDRLLVAQRDFSQKQRETLAGTGAAMDDGSFPIQNEEDLHNAVRLVGHAHDPAAAKAHIISRARSLGLTAALPQDWVTQSGANVFQTQLTALKAKIAQEGALGEGYGQESKAQAKEGEVNPDMPTFCPHCHQKLNEHGVCPSCGYRYQVEQGAVPLLQVDTLKRVVTGVVQTPDTPTIPASMPDTELVYPRSTIQQMAWGFMKNFQNGEIGLRHTEVQNGVIVPQGGTHANVVESYIAPVDMHFSNGRTVAQGSWIMSVQINNNDAWNDVLAGRLQAFSLASTSVDFTDLDEEGQE